MTTAYRPSTAGYATTHHHGGIRAQGPVPSKPDFRDGSILEEREKSGGVVTKYRVGKLLGRGGFAKCYEVRDLTNHNAPPLAVKVIDRASIQKAKILAKLQSEIAIHRRMKHRHIVGFHRTFQDDWFVYIILELCGGQTLMEIAKTRRRFSVAETQHIMIQTLASVDYMHRNHVIHRDLKLGNIMMDSDMNVKVGDFGLAAELLYDGERKRTICGTPNYIAPEILNGARDGHSFEVDVWSLGVILYTLLVGEPPFQTSDVQATYNRIKQCRYTFPPGVDVCESGKELIHRILQPKPDRRPTLVTIRDDPFFKLPTPPTTAPITLFPDHLRRQREYNLQMQQQNGGGACAAPAAPQAQDERLAKQRDALRPLNFNAGAAAPGVKPTELLQQPQSARGPATAQQQQPAARQRSGSVPTLGDRNNNNAGWAAPPPEASKPSTAGHQQPLTARPQPSSAPSSTRASPTKPAAPAAVSNNNNKVLKGHLGEDNEEDRNHLQGVHDELHRTLLEADEFAKQNKASGATAAAAAARQQCYPGVTPPTVWVTDCANFSEKYGMAYTLNTAHTGVHYNDSTKMVWEPNTNKVEYYARIKETINGAVHATDKRESFLMDAAPEALNKKTTLIKYFKSYLSRARGRRDGVEVVKCSPFTNFTVPAITSPHMQDDIVYVKRWMITSQATIFRLSNKTMQVCFNDKTEVILSSELRVVTYTDEKGQRQTMPLSAVANQPDEMASRLRYTKDIICRLISNREI